jgi:hypothetical protein
MRNFSAHRFAIRTGTHQKAFAFASLWPTGVLLFAPEANLWVNWFAH